METTKGDSQTRRRDSVSWLARVGDGRSNGKPNDELLDISKRKINRARRAKSYHTFLSMYITPEYYVLRTNQFELSRE